MITTTVRGPVSGESYTIRFPDGGKHISKYMTFTNWYELKMLQDIASRMKDKPPGLVIDVGAYCGTHSVFFATQLSGMHVYAFEPVQEQFDYLIENLGINHIGNVTAYRIALSDAEGYATHRRIDEANTGTDKIVFTPIAMEGEIDVRPLDYYDFNNVRLIKIDVEGMELNVLQGSIETIEREHPLLYVESPDHIAEVRDFLIPMGYREFGQFNATPTYGFKYYDD